jgi:hypothetical protein
MKPTARRDWKSYPERIGAVEKILTVKRDDSGKLSGAVSQTIS